MDANTPAYLRPPSEALGRLGHCPDCGYALEGLPAGHRCPECGFEPSPGLVVLWGWSGPWSADPMQRPAKPWRPWAWWAMVGVMTLITGNYVVALLFLVFLALPTLYHFVKLRSGYTMPERPVQLRIAPAGIAQRVGYGKAVLNPWREDMCLEFRTTAQNGLHISGYVETGWGLKSAQVCNIEVALSENDKDHVRKWLGEWLRAAGGKSRPVV